MKIPDCISGAFPRRADDAHKYSIGTVTAVGGSERFVHAPVICALGARAAGAGLVHLVAPRESLAAAGALVPEATFMERTPSCVPPKADVIAIGMGLGDSEAARTLVSETLAGPVRRLVIDADALSALPERNAGDAEVILTPHEGEAARLLACTSHEVHKDRIGTAKQIAERYRAICVLKGSHTLVAAPDGRMFTCEAGNPFMAMGGMGDLLSGVIAARWAYIKDAYLAACSSVWLHASASDAIVKAREPGDPSIINTAAMIGSTRVALESRTA